MKVLFKKDNKIEEVNDNYALNYLIPKGLVLKVTDRMQKEMSSKVEERKEEIEKVRIEQERIAEKINNKIFKLKLKANDKGELYAKVGEKEIQKLIGIKKGVSILIKEPIKKTGEYSLDLKIGENRVKINLKISA